MIGCSCGFSSFLGTLFHLEKSFPVIALDFSNPSTTKITFTHALSGEVFNVDSVSSDVKFEAAGQGKFTAAFATKAGDHTGTYSVNVNQQIKFSFPYAYFVKSSASITIEEQKFPLLKLKIQIEGKGKKEVDYVIVELQHKEKKDAVI